MCMGVNNSWKIPYKHVKLIKVLFDIVEASTSGYGRVPACECLNPSGAF